MKSIYLDYAATTPVDTQVILAMQAALKEDFGNPSSTYKLGREVKGKIEKARDLIANSIHGKASDITFTSSGTEANATALLTTARRYRNAHATGGHIITSACEHPSVYNTMKKLEAAGFAVTYLDFDFEGHIAMAAFEAAIQKDTFLVSIMHANNEVGSIQPIEAIGQICHQQGIFFHTDTVQSYMKLPIDVQTMYIDALSLSAHKIYGPKGIGFLYYRNSEQDFTSFLPGGGQEHGRRAGTEAYPLIAGLASAVQLAKEDLDEEQMALKALREHFLTKAVDLGLGFEINGPKKAEMANILNLWWPGHLSEQVLIKCDLANIYLSAGSACSAGSLRPSRILVNMYGENSPRLKESLRFSFGKDTTVEEIDTVLTKLSQF